MAQPSMFVRKASGLVRSWSTFDGFVYSFFSVNLVTLGFYIFAFAPYVPDGNLVAAVAIATVLIIFEVVVYAMMVAVMPRAGGDYVWQSRILGGGIGFVLAIAGWGWILWHWLPLYGNMLAFNVFTPVLGMLGGWTNSAALINAATWFVTTNGLFVSSLVVIGLAFIYISLGMSWYARIQKVCFWIGIAGMATMIIMLLANTSADFISSFNHYANAFFASGESNTYQQILAAAAADGYTAPPLSSFKLGASLALIPMVVFYLLWPNWGATLYGEVRGASDFKRNFRSMFYGLVVTGALSVVVLLLFNRTFGWEFFNAANLTFYEGTSPFGVCPYPALLVSFMTDSPILQMWLLLSMSCWFFGWCGTIFLSSTRVIFAAAFDRILPEWMAQVTTKFRAPLNALLVMAVGGTLTSAAMHYSANIEKYALNSTLVIAIMYLGTAVAATILPYRDKELYKASPIARMKLFGLPLITVMGSALTLFLLFLLYMWMRYDVYGLNEPTSFIYIGAFYLATIVLYYVSKWYRKRQGIDLQEIHKTIPVE